MSKFELTDEMRAAVYLELREKHSDRLIEMAKELTRPNSSWHNVPDYSIVTVEPGGLLCWYADGYIYASQDLMYDDYEGQMADSYILREVTGPENYNWWKSVSNGSIVELQRVRGQQLYWYSDGMIYEKYDDMISSTNGFDASGPGRVIRDA